MTAGADQKARWKAVRELLHVDDQCEDLTSEVKYRFCQILSDKLHRVADKMSSRWKFHL